MSTVMIMHWPEASRKQYEQARKEINWESNIPQGAKFHVAWSAGDGCTFSTYGSRRKISKNSCRSV